jgi:hypothetical protein
MMPGARIRPFLLMSWLVLPLLSACGGSPASPDLIIDPILVDRLDVVVGAGAPMAAVEAHVQGVVGDGCSVLHSVKQERSGSTVTITILRERPKDAICTQQALLYDARIPLDGTFSSGAFLVRANGVERAFTVP